MRKLLRAGATTALFAILASAADNDAAIRTTFVKPWMEAVQAKDPDRVKRLFHPKVLACLNEQTRDYFDNILANETRFEGRRPYRVIQIVALLGPPPDWLPADSFSYPIQPTYQVEVELGETTLVRYLAPANGSWYEVYPCPNEKGIALMHERMAKAKEQRARAEQLASELKDPLLAELKDLINQNRTIDAVKRYREATGTDLTTARMVVDVVRIAK